MCERMSFEKSKRSMFYSSVLVHKSTTAYRLLVVDFAKALSRSPWITFGGFMCHPRILCALILHLDLQSLALFHLSVQPIPHNWWGREVESSAPFSDLCSSPHRIRLRPYVTWHHTPSWRVLFLACRSHSVSSFSSNFKNFCNKSLINTLSSELLLRTQPKIPVLKTCSRMWFPEKKYVDSFLQAHIYIHILKEYLFTWQALS